MMTGFPKTFGSEGPKVRYRQIRPPGIFRNSAQDQADQFLLRLLARSGVICPNSGPPQHEPVVRMT
eukprot:2918820-Karenia_brevis.AAC.1